MAQLHKSFKKLTITCSMISRARNNFLIIHDCDLQRWAKNKARELDFELPRFENSLTLK